MKDIPRELGPGFQYSGQQVDGQGASAWGGTGFHEGVDEENEDKHIEDAEEEGGNSVRFGDNEVLASGAIYFHLHSDETKGTSSREESILTRLYVRPHEPSLSVIEAVGLSTQTHTFQDIRISGATPAFTRNIEFANRRVLGKSASHYMHT